MSKENYLINVAIIKVFNLLQSLMYLQIISNGQQQLQIIN